MRNASSSTDLSIPLNRPPLWYNHLSLNSALLPLWHVFKPSIPPAVTCFRTAQTVASQIVFDYELLRSPESGIALRYELNIYEPEVPANFEGISYTLTALDKTKNKPTKYTRDLIVTNYRRFYTILQFTICALEFQIQYARAHATGST